MAIVNRDVASYDSWGIVEESVPPGRFRDRRRLDAEKRRRGATGAGEDLHPEGGDTDPRAHSGA
jgi:hypothetical protein